MSAAPLKTKPVALPLRAVDMPSHMAAPAPSAGYAPEVAWVSLSDLVVDGRYQRPVTRSGVNTIHKIMQNFRWTRFAPCIVTRIEEGRYAIIDGQHRSTAALSLGYERVPCAIVKADPKEAAAIFAAVNGVVTPMSAQMVYKAALFAGEPWAATLDALTRKHGMEILPYPVQRSTQLPLQTMAVGTLRKLLDRLGAEKLDLVLAAEGYRVLASDIAPAAGPHKHPVVRHDFLASSGLGGGAGAAIVTNPPYGLQSRLALAFLHKGLALIEQGPAIMALLLPFEFDARPSRSALVGEHPFFLAKVTVGERIRWANLPQKDATPMAHHAWFIWSAHVPHHIRAQRFPKVMVR